MMLPEEKRRNVLHFNATDAEKDLIHKRMETVGIGNLAMYLRKMALNGYVLKLDYAEIREMVRLLGNMTNNINQIAARINSGGNLYETEICEIEENQKTISGLLRKLIKKLDKVR